MYVSRSPTVRCHSLRPGPPRAAEAAKALKIFHELTAHLAEKPFAGVVLRIRRRQQLSGTEIGRHRRELQAAYRRLRLVCVHYNPVRRRARRENINSRQVRQLVIG